MRCTCTGAAAAAVSADISSTIMQLPRPTTVDFDHRHCAKDRATSHRIQSGTGSCATGSGQVPPALFPPCVTTQRFKHAHSTPHTVKHPHRICLCILCGHRVRTGCGSAAAQDVERVCTILCSAQDVDIATSCACSILCHAQDVAIPKSCAYLILCQNHAQDLARAISGTG